MKKRFAVPIENGVLCAHFGHCEKFAIVDVDNDSVKEVTEITPPEHEPGLYPRWIAGHGVTDVIAGGMGQKAITLFNDEKINVYVGAPVNNAASLVKDFLEGVLVLNGNYCDH